MTAALEGGEWSAARLSRTLPPGKTLYTFDRKLSGPQGRSGRAENLVATGIRSRTVHPVVSRYTDWATRPTNLWILLEHYHSKTILPKCVTHIQNKLFRFYKIFIIVLKFTLFNIQMNKKFYWWKLDLVGYKRLNIACCVVLSNRTYVQPDDGLDKKAETCSCSCS